MGRGSAPPATRSPPKATLFLQCPGPQPGQPPPPGPASKLQPASARCVSAVGLGAQVAGMCVCKGAGHHRSLPEREAPSWGRWGCGGAAGSRGGPRRTEPGGLGRARSTEASLFSVALLSLAREGEGTPWRREGGPALHSPEWKAGFGVRGPMGTVMGKTHGSESHAPRPLATRPTQANLTDPALSCTGAQPMRPLPAPATKACVQMPTSRTNPYQLRPAGASPRRTPARPSWPTLFTLRHMPT